MKRKPYPYISKFTDRHGKVRYRFRRKGYPDTYLRAPYASKDFEREYAACLASEPITIGADRIIIGSVSDVIARYYSDTAFMDLRASTQKVYRGVLEGFRDVVGNEPIRRFDADRIAKLMTAMRHKPHAANRLRKLLGQLFIIARRSKLVPYGFDPVKDTRAPKIVSEGFHSWTEAELDTFEAKHPIGTKPRLAFALLLYAAQRSGDVRFMTHQSLEGGRIRLKQSKTNTAVDVPVVAPLREVLEAGPLGTVTLIETKGGEPFTEKGFYNLLKRACIDAGLSHCAPHGLRKSAARRCREAGCSDEEGMAITGHRTVREYRHYAGNDSHGDRADAAMGKVMANQSEKVAAALAQDTENEGQ